MAADGAPPQGLRAGDAGEVADVADAAGYVGGSGVTYSLHGGFDGPMGGGDAGGQLGPLWQP